MNMNVGSHVFLLGPHGCGKSTIGRHLAAQGYVHLSIGLIGRLARRGARPADLPVRVLQVMARHVPGEALDPRAATEILDYARSLDRVVIDGFPAHVEHLALLNDIERWKFVYVLTPRQIREQRLRARAETTKRGWSPGLKSVRDSLLPSLCWHLRSNGQLLRHLNG
ncbi:MULTISPECIES: AAA family ATPase [Pandoraea]|nr:MULTISPECIES: AAA family ATPase [Pandoraea]